MPTSYVKKVARATGISTKHSEAKWEDAKAAAKKQYGDIEKSNPEKFFAIVTTIYKHMAHVKESNQETESMKISEIIAQVREGKITAAKAAEQIADQTTTSVLERMKPLATPAHQAWGKIAFGRHNIPFFKPQGKSVSENIDEAGPNHPNSTGIAHRAGLAAHLEGKKGVVDGDDVGILSPRVLSTNLNYSNEYSDNPEGTAHVHIHLVRNDDGSHSIHGHIQHDGTPDGVKKAAKFQKVLKDLGHKVKPGSGKAQPHPRGKELQKMVDAYSSVGPSFPEGTPDNTMKAGYRDHAEEAHYKTIGALNPEAEAALRKHNAKMKEGRSKREASAAKEAKAAEMAKAAKRPKAPKPVKENLDERARPYAAAPFARTNKRVFNKAIPLFVPNFADKITHDQKPILVTKSMMETMAITASLHGHDHPYQDRGVKETDVFVVLEGDKFVTIKAGTLTPIMEGATVEEVVKATVAKMPIGSAVYGVDIEGELVKIADVGNKGTNESCEGDHKAGKKVTYKGVTFTMNGKGQWCADGKCVEIDSPLCHALDQLAGK